MQKLKSILDWLSGKKSIIASILMTIVAYLSAKQLIGEYEVALIGGLVTIIFGSASYLTGKYVYKK